MATEHTELSAYLDGELAAAERRRIETRLEAEPDYAQELRALERTRTMILTTLEHPRFHAALMERVREEAQPKRTRSYPFLAFAVAAAAVVLLAVAYFGLFGGPPAPAPGQQAVAPPAVQQEQREPSNFERVKMAQVEAPLSPSAPAAALPQIDVLGTTTGAEPQAVLRVEGKRSHAYEVGAEIAPNVTLQRVEKGQVVLLHEGQEIVLKMGQSPLGDPGDLLDGVWNLARILPNGGHTEAEPVTISHEGSTLTSTVHGTGEKLTGEFEVIGNKLYLSYAGSGGEVAAIEGEISDDKHMIALKEVPSDEAEAAGNVAPSMILTRVGEADAQQLLLAQEALRDCEKDLDAIFAAVKSYREKNDGMPETLAALSPEYVKDPALISSTEERTVKYVHNKQKLAGLPTTPRPSEPSMTPRETYPNRLMAFESQLRQEGFDGFLWPDAIVKIEYTQAKVAGTLYSTGKTDVRPDGGEPLAGASNLAAMRASDQNNLKQLGLVIKMYANEHDGYTPPGWVSVYPEYLTDPNVLTSPKDKPGTESYDYLLPATQLEKGLFEERIAAQDPRWIELAYLPDGSPNPAAEALFQSTIPIAINKTDWPDGGRNMLFGDGHVEYVKDWRERLKMLP